MRQKLNRLRELDKEYSLPLVQQYYQFKGEVRLKSDKVEGLQYSNFLIIKMQATFDDKIFNLPCEDFYIAVASNPYLLQKGYEIVYKYLSLSSFNRQQTLLHLLSQKAPVLTLATRTYPVVYSDESVGVSAGQKTKTKEFLILEILLKQLLSCQNNSKVSNKKTLTNFLLFLIHFHNNQGFQGWVPFYEKLLEELIKINSQLIGFVLIEILKNSDDRVSCFSKHILPFVINSQVSLKICEQESLEIIYYCIKSMAYMKGTEDDVLEQYFEPFEDKIMEYIFSSISKSINIMKFSLKILTVFAADYEIELEKQMIIKLKQCSKQLVIEHMNSRIQQRGKEQFDDQDEDQDSISISVIIYQLIELFQTLLSVEQMKMADYEVYLALCLPSLMLSKSEYLNYSTSTQGYLADIEDDAEKTLRNKVISFLLELYEGQFSGKAKAKMQTKLLEYVMLLQLRSQGSQKFGQQLVNFYSSISFPISIQNQHLPLLEQSLTFLLYHLTQEVLTFDAKNLQQNKQTLMIILGKNIEISTTTNDPLLKVACINVLNKLIKSMNKSVKQAYYGFLVDSMGKITDFQQQKGFLLGICRGIAYVSNDASISICQKGNQKGITILMLQNLTKYLLDQNTLQQSAHLILQFFLTLLKKVDNAKQVFQLLISSQVQIHILSTFIHDGMIAEVVTDLLGEIATQEFITFVYGEFAKGLAKQFNLAVLIGKWISLGQIKLAQNDIIALIKAYKSSFVAKIVKEYLKTIQQNSAKNLSTELIRVLNENIHPSWVLIMLGCNILNNPELLLINTIQNITHQLTSQYEIQSQLLLPYYTFMNDPTFGVNILKSKSPQLYEAFIHKLIRYAALFQGPNLKVITSIVLLNICEIDNKKIMPVLDLISTYGNTLQNEEWEDEKDEEYVIDRMFNMKMTNDEVETDFAEIFPTKVCDMELVTSQVNKLSALINH